MSDVIPTYGYRSGEARIFDLKPGEKLPEGWHDTPQPEPAPQREPRKRPKLTLDGPVE